jgi:hypothetical protein
LKDLEANRYYAVLEGRGVDSKQTRTVASLRVKTLTR